MIMVTTKQVHGHDHYHTVLKFFILDVLRCHWTDLFYVTKRSKIQNQPSLQSVHCPVYPQNNYGTHSHRTTERMTQCNEINKTSHVTQWGHVKWYYTMHLTSGTCGAYYFFLLPLFYFQNVLVLFSNANDNSILNSLISRTNHNFTNVITNTCCLLQSKENRTL